TKPFICRGDDDAFYFVKTIGSAGRPSLVHEWVCGHLAKALTLPIAPFEIVHVPTALADFAGFGDLSAGPAFGSRQQHVAEITLQACTEIPAELRQDILLFDWW